MKKINVLWQVGLLFLVFQTGILIRDLLNLFIPGSVIGLILMFTILATGILPVRFIDKGAGFMIRHLVLFFIPATVGIMDHYELFAGKGMFLIIITIVSTFLVLAGSGLTAEYVYKKGIGDDG